MAASAVAQAVTCTSGSAAATTRVVLSKVARKLSLRNVGVIGMVVVAGAGATTSAYTVIAKGCTATGGIVSNVRSVIRGGGRVVGRVVGGATQRTGCGASGVGKVGGLAGSSVAGGEATIASASVTRGIGRWFARQSQAVAQQLYI